MFKERKQRGAFHEQKMRLQPRNSSTTPEAHRLWLALNCSQSVSKIKSIVREMVGKFGAESLEQAIDGKQGGVTPLVMAASQGRRDVVDMLLEQGAKCSTRGGGPAAKRNTPLTMAVRARRGSVSVMKALLEAGASPDEADERGVTCLLIASGYGLFPAMDLLLSFHANVDRADLAGHTPLMAAIDYEQTKAANKLLSAGAAVDLANIDGQTALHMASGVGLHGVVDKLILAKSSIDIADKDGETALHIASMGGHARVVKSLVSAGAKLDCKNSKGAIPLYLAAQAGHKAIVKLFLDAGPHLIDTPKYDGLTPLIGALWYNQQGTAVQLLAAGASLDHICVGLALQLSPKATELQQNLRAARKALFAQQSVLDMMRSCDPSFGDKRERGVGVPLRKRKAKRGAGVVLSAESLLTMASEMGHERD